MNIDINQIPHWLWTFLLSPMGIIIAIGVVSVGGLKLLAGKQQEVEYVRAILISVHSLMKGQLGDKAEAVYQAWLSGLDAIADGDFTPTEMVEELTKFIKIALGKQNIVLNSDEQSVVVQAASMTAQVASVNGASTKKAVAMMMEK
jgi:hypothetical protein